MFVRRNRNKNGSVSVQIVSKDRGRYRSETIGTSKDPDQIEQYVQEAENRIRYPENQPSLFPVLTDADRTIKSFVEEMKNAQVRTIGPELIFGTIFDRIGFNAIPDELFRHIVIARLAYPVSKLKTTDYLQRYRNISVDIDTVYRFLDRLNEKYKEKALQIAYEHTKKTLKTISVVFYDMTTLYFETEEEDDLRKIGFSKDGKFQCPQIMLGLLVGENGYPIGYDIFERNTFEGHTLIPVLEKIQRKYEFGKPIVVADAGLLSKENIEKLKGSGYKYIIGARIKNESEKVSEEILEKSKNMQDGESFVIKREKNTRLVVTYSEKRAKKDVYNREKGLKKLEKRVQSGKLTKEHINNRGYNKFLSLKGEVEVEMNQEKIQEDKQWDGLKGYATNTRYGAKKIVEYYGNLWHIEKAFRISKTDLRIRPVHHYKKRRIEAHICIAFVAYAIWKEVERLLEKAKVDMSPKRAAELTHNMYEIEYILPQSKKREKTLLQMDDEQKMLYEVIHGQ